MVEHGLDFCRFGIKLLHHVFQSITMTRYPAAALFFPQTVVRCLRKISRGLAQNIVAAPQLTNLLLQLFESLTLITCEPTITCTIIAFMSTQSGSECVGTTANFWRDGVDGGMCMFRVIFTALFQQHSDSPLTQLWWVTVARLDVISGRLSLRV